MASDPPHLPHDAQPERDIEAVLHALDEKVQYVASGGELVQQLRQMLAHYGSGKYPPQDQTLRQDEQRFRSLFDYNVDPVFWVDPQGRFAAINPAGEKLTGYSVDEIQKLTLQDVCVPECLEDTLHVFQLALAGDLRHVETAIYRKDGRRVELGVAGGPILVDGQLQGIFGVAKDITESKRAARALQESHDRLALALEAGQAGMVQWDLRTNKAWWNAYAFQIHGYPPGAFAPTFEFWLSSLYPEDAPAVVKAIKRCMEQRQPDITVEYRVLRPTGEIRWVRGVGRFAFDPAGVAESFTGIAMDITPQRRAEERLSFLSKASGLLASSLDPGQILSRLTRLSVPFLADFCVIYQIDSPQTFHLVARTHVRPEFEPVLDRIGERFQTIPTHPGSRIRAAIQTGEVQLLSHATVEDARRATQDPELLAL